MSIPYLFHFKILPALLYITFRGYLADSGWFRSVIEKRPVDKNGNPIPWTTYSFIEFIGPRLKLDFRVFEYGAGASSLYFSSRVSQVVSVEHDLSWKAKVESSKPDNVEILYRDSVDSKGYVGGINRLPAFDIIFIDAIERVACLRESPKHLTARGIVVLDDSEREEYSEGIQFLMKKGFRKIDFWGFSPGFIYRKCTTIFYRDNNCIGI